MKVCYNYFLLILLVIFTNPVHIVFASESDNFEQAISISFYESELGEILNELSLLTGVKFIYDENLVGKKVSGTYDELPLRVVVHRLMRGTNSSLVLDENADTILIEGFGPTDYVTTDNGSIYFADTDLTYTELEALRIEQLKKLELDQKDGFNEDFNLSHAEMEALHEEQLSGFGQEQKSGNSMLPGLEMTVGNYQLMVEEQLSQFDRLQKDDEVILPDFGKTAVDFKNMHSEQIAEFNQQQEDEDEYIPEFGMTRGQQKILHAQQLNLAKNK